MIHHTNNIINNYQLLIARKEKQCKNLLLADAIFNISVYISGIIQFAIFIISADERKKFLSGDLGQVAMALLLIFSLISLSFHHYISNELDKLKRLNFLKYSKSLEAFKKENDIQASKPNLIDRIDEKFFSHFLLKILKDLFNFFYTFIDVLLVMGLTSYGEDYSLFTYLDLQEKQIVNQDIYPSYSNYSFLSAVCLSVCLLIYIYQLISVVNDFNKQKKYVNHVGDCSGKSQHMMEYIRLQKEKFYKQKFELFNLSFRFFTTGAILALYLKRGMSFGDINTGYTTISIPTLFFGILMICNFIFSVAYLLLDKKVDNLEKKYYSNYYIFLNSINSSTINRDVSVTKLDKADKADKDFYGTRLI